MSKRDTAGKVVELKQQTKLLFFSLFLHLIIKKIQYNNLKNKKPVKKFLLSLCFLLALSPAARSSIYLFEQFDDTFLLNGWSVVGTDMNIGIATSSDNGNHWHEGWVQNFGATGNHEISQEIATEDMDDLEVAVWIQNYDTKKVYNSHFLFETPNHPFAPEQLTLTKEGNTFTAQWNAPAGNAPTGFAAMPAIDPALRAEMGERGDDEKIKIVVLMNEQSDATALSREANFFANKQERRAFVVETLKRQAETSQAELLGLLEEMKQHDMVADIQSLWLVNAISCQATKTAINSLEQKRGIKTIAYREETQWIADGEVEPAVKNGDRDIAEFLYQIDVPPVWDLGYTGQGVLVAIIDTGVRLDHEDLAGRFWDGGSEYPNHGYDFYYNDNDPGDVYGHGTEVAGIVCGTGAGGTKTGVAPDATIMVLKAFRDDGVGEETPWVAAMQFAIEHGADVLNMSLGRPKPEPAQKLMMRQACDNTLAAGVVAAACAGNVGSAQFMIPVPQNIYTPGDCPPPHLHPDQMVNAGGTSAASPCVAGTIALMLSKNPNLTPAQIDEILENTALKLTEHKSNNFGSGVVNALAAIEAVQPYDGLAENDVKAAIYPNPSADVFTIRCEGMRHVEVYSVDGKLVKSQPATGSQCQISGLDSGVYVVKVMADSGTVTKRMMKL